MFNYTSPKNAGISSAQIKKYISILEKYGFSTHNIIMARGNDIFFEQYWKPFDKDFPHRMYSVTKSIVALAIGFLLQDGLISLDDKIIDYFTDDIPEDLIENVKNQTIKDMLMMSTGYIEKNGYWFHKHPTDRVKYYFDSSREAIRKKDDISRIPGTFFEYDSNGSFILSSLVEKISGKLFKDYMDEKLFNKIGVESAKFLMCPGGHTWGDSALICTPLDMLKIGRFTLNYGSWNGEQILSSDYLKTATSKLIDNSLDGYITLERHGYGYQIWKTWQNSFFFNGMGCELMICVPHKDLIFVYNGDNQGNNIAKTIIVDRFFEEIVDNMDTENIKDDIQNELSLKSYCENLELYSMKAEKTSPIVNRINGKTFLINDNEMGITKIKFNFSNDEGSMEYINKQGEKKLLFGINKNVFCLFPEMGYSKNVGNVREDGNYYECACSAGWTEDNRFNIMVQIIGDYFGRLYMSFCFKNEKIIALNFKKTAEDFLNEYNSYADGHLVD